MSVSDARSVHNGIGLGLGYVLRDRYKINALIGINGFEITYKAWDKKETRDVAIKEYCPQELVNRANGLTDYMLLDAYNNEYNYGLRKFMQEARSLSAFKGNNNIVTVYDYFEEGDTGFMVMEYLNGLSLKEYMERCDSKVSEEMMIHVSFSAIEALNDIHSAGMVHRDLSPESIFICDDKKVKLIDFGVVDNDMAHENLSGTIVLKPGYAPLEQYASGNKTGPWTDIYALGATLYYITTGTRPLDAPSRVETDELREPKEINARIPDPLNRAIMKAMSIRKEDRYDSVVKMAEDIMDGDLQTTGLTEKLTSEPDTTSAAEQKVTQKKKQALRLAGAKDLAMKNHSFMLANAEQSGILTSADKLPTVRVKTTAELRMEKEKKKEHRRRNEKALRTLGRFLIWVAILFIVIPSGYFAVKRVLRNNNGIRLESVRVNASETDFQTSRKKFTPGEDRYYHFRVGGLTKGETVTLIAKVHTPGKKTEEKILGVVDKDFKGVILVMGSESDESFESETEKVEIYDSTHNRLIGTMKCEIVQY